MNFGATCRSSIVSKWWLVPSSSKDEEQLSTVRGPGQHLERTLAALGKDLGPVGLTLQNGRDACTLICNSREVSTETKAFSNPQTSKDVCRQVLHVRVVVRWK